MRARRKASRTFRLMMVTAVAVVVVAMLAAPALAAPAETEWTVSPASKIITYGNGVTLNGTLMSDSVAVGGLWVDFAQATTQSGSYEVLYKVTTADERLLHRHLLGRRDAAPDHVLPLPVDGRRPVPGLHQRRHPRAGQAVARQADGPVEHQERQEVHGKGHGQARRGRQPDGQDQGLPQEQQWHLFQLQDIHRYHGRHRVHGEHQDQQDRQVQVQGLHGRRTRSSPPTRQASAA